MYTKASKSIKFGRFLGDTIWVEAYMKNIMDDIIPYKNHQDLENEEEEEEQADDFNPKQLKP